MKIMWKSLSKGLSSEDVPDFAKAKIKYTTGFINIDLRRESIIEISDIAHAKLKNDLLDLLLEFWSSNLDFNDVSVAYDRGVVFNQATVIVPFEGALSSAQLNNIWSFICKENNSFFKNYYIFENKINICGIYRDQLHT